MRKVFFSFDWDDAWKAFQVRNSWVTVEVVGYKDAAVVEKVKRRTPQAIKAWIDGQMQGTSVTVVLIGQKTCESRWVNYEIKKSIQRENGLLGIYIHNVKDRNGCTSSKGVSPFGQPPFNLPLIRGKSPPLPIIPPSSERKLMELDFALFASRRGLTRRSVIPPSSRRKLTYPRCLHYDWVDDHGRENIASWIETAARQAGR